MKTLLKLVLGIIIFLIIIIGVPLGILYYNLSDSTDDTPLEVYSEDISYSTVLTNLFNESLDLNNKDSINFTFTEDELNKFIFGYIREYINTNYNPKTTNPTDEEAYIDTTNITLPVLGERQVLVKSAYAVLVDKKLEIYLTLDILGVKSRAKLIASFEENADNYIIIFQTVGIGKMNLFSGLGKTLFNGALKASSTTEDRINDELKSKNLPFIVDLDGQSLYIPKDEINLLITKLINPKSINESDQSNMMASLLDILANKDNDLLDIGIIDNKFGMKFDLSKFKVNSDLVVLSDDIKSFEKTSFIQSKVQGYIISTLSDMNNAKMYFTNKELNQIVYSQSNSYEAFKVSIPLPNSESTFDFVVEGIILSFTPDLVTIRIIINLNGLTTSLLVTGTIENNNSNNVTIKINDNITLGQDTTEGANEYITANSNLILGLLGKNIDSMGIMEYNSESKSLILSADSFTQLMAIEETNVTPITIDRIKIVNGGLETYGTPGGLSLPVTAASIAIQNALATNIFDASDFITTDPVESQLVNNLIRSLNDISNSISDNNLTETQTDALLENYNSLSDQNKAIFLNKLEEESISPDLLSLYDSLFGK